MDHESAYAPRMVIVRPCSRSPVQRSRKFQMRGFSRGFLLADDLTCITSNKPLCASDTGKRSAMTIELVFRSGLRPSRDVHLVDCATVIEAIAPKIFLVLPSVARILKDSRGSVSIVGAGMRLT